MAKYSLNQLKADVGLLSLTDCTTEENQKFAELMKNGEALPEDIYPTENMDAKGNRAFCRGTLNATPRQRTAFCPDANFKGFALHYGSDSSAFGARDSGLCGGADFRADGVKNGKIIV